jgi:hypothetical protein
VVSEDGRELERECGKAIRKAWYPRIGAGREREITITPAAVVVSKLLHAPGGKGARDKRYH